MAEDGTPQTGEGEAPRSAPGSGMLAWAIVAACLAASAAVLVPPLAEDAAYAALAPGAAGVDAMVTGTVSSPREARRYTVHRSVLRPEGSSCVTFGNGTAYGAC